MRQRRRRVPEDSCGSRVKSKQITGLEITYDKSHDLKSFISL